MIKNICVTQLKTDVYVWDLSLWRLWKKTKPRTFGLIYACLTKDLPISKEGGDDMIGFEKNQVLIFTFAYKKLTMSSLYD